jgi:triacylglycerol lipase
MARGALQLIRRAAKHVERVARALDVPGAGNRIEKRTDFSRCDRPVLLLHGFLSSRRTFDVLERRLRRDGYGPFTLDLGGLGRTLNTRGIDDLADFVRGKIERIYARNPGLGPLTIVGHSKGGLVAAYYVKKLGGWRRTRAVVTLGTPHHGTPVAYLGLPLAVVASSVWQMLPGSEFLARLHDGPWPAQVRLTSVWSRLDPWAPYPTSLLETHGLPHLSNVEVSGDHRAFLTSKRLYEVLVRELRAAEASAPVVRGRLTAMRGGRGQPAAGIGAAAASAGGTGAA